MDSTTMRPHTDRKTLRKKQQKKIAQGHAQDDHEEEQTWQQTTVREQMAAYKEIIDGSSLEGYRKIAAKEHEER